MNRILAVLFSFTLLLAAGCGMASTAMKTTVCGKEMLFMLGDEGPERAKDGRATVIDATFIPTKDNKHIWFIFHVSKQPSAPAVKSIKVENVSDEVPEVLVFDETPKFDAHGNWSGHSADRLPSEPNLSWFYHEGNTPRVYRFTIVYADGKTSELYQLDVVAAFVKAIVRKQFGMK
jgi:hypothetical protein